jgi:hypothetical protein
LHPYEKEKTMVQRHEDDGNPLLGLAAGLGAGLFGAFAMSAFQALLARADITSGVTGTPSTEKAADRLSENVSGRPVGYAMRATAGEAIHYGVGSLIGSLYGFVAEAEPRVRAGGGAAFGAAAATVVDETLVPIARFGQPFWRAPWMSHPYSYASHLVFGVATEGARKLVRRFLVKVRAGFTSLRTGKPRPPLETRGSDGWRALRLAFLLGATAGPRTSAPLAAVTWAARLGWIDLRGSRLAFLSSKQAVAITTPMALGEIVVDKLGSTPDRTHAVGVAARAVSGALSGAALVGGVRRRRPLLARPARWPRPISATPSAPAFRARSTRIGRSQERRTCWRSAAP